MRSLIERQGGVATIAPSMQEVPLDENPAALQFAEQLFAGEIAHDELTVRVPVDKVDEVGMRPPISLEDVEDLFVLLAKKDVREPANWSRRFKNHQEKLKSGDVYQVAEVVRNLALREKTKGLSAGEKNMYTKARKVLVSELSFALNVSEESAMGQVEEQLV
jgi:CarD family transcriptional regulator